MKAHELLIGALIIWAVLNAAWTWANLTVLDNSVAVGIAATSSILFIVAAAYMGLSP